MKKIIATLFFTLLISSAVFAQQTTSFTYQGKLNNSSTPASGTYDFKFELYDALTNGTLIGTQTSNSVTVTSGIFTVQLNFGVNAFNGNDRFLDISVKLPSAGSYTTLTPRQKIASVPYATKAINSDLAITAQNSISLGGITANNYLLNNGDGSQLINVSGGFKWNVISSNQQAQPNNGYIVNTPATFTNETIINLPSNPNVGDVVRIEGVSGNWRISQNTGQSITSNNSVSPNGLWTHRNSPADGNAQSSGVYTEIKTSADGQKIIMILQINSALKTFTSIDGGNTWTERTAVNNSLSIAITADGSKMFALNGAIIYQSVDNGATWTTLFSTTNFWFRIVVSSDGTKLAAVGNFSSNPFGSLVAISTDSGLTWTQNQLSSQSFQYPDGGIAMSADATKLVVVTNFGVFTSTNSGLTWITRENTLRNFRWRVTCSSDGNHIAYIDGGSTSSTTGTLGSIHISHDSGITWAIKNPNGALARWHGLASSANGKNLVVTRPDGFNTNATAIYFSSDFGETWTVGMPNLNLYAVASTSDGSKFFGYGIGVSGLDTMPGGWVGTKVYVSPQSQVTTLGTSGSISGGVRCSVELVYIGNGKFLITNSKGEITFS